MVRYKLVRIVNRRYLSANQYAQESDGVNCLEYVVGKETSAKRGVACYKAESNATVLHHILETRDYFNKGKPIALLKLESIGRCIPYPDARFKSGGVYRGGVHYPKVKVLEVVQLF